MAKPWAKKFYNSAAWKRARLAYIKSVYGLCEWCGRPGYIVDHIVELTPDNISDPTVTLNQDNFQFLCLDCHNKKTFGWREPIREGLMFDEQGQIVTVSPPIK